jgi:hypothetical protein
MNIRKHQSRPLSICSLLCLVLATVMTQASKGVLKQKRSVELRASKTTIIYPCPPGPGSRSLSGSCPSEIDPRVGLTAIVKEFNKESVYSYSVTGGQVVGEGSEVTWNLSGVWPGYYTATVEVHDNKSHRAVASLNVAVANCADCIFYDLPCGTMIVDCYDAVKSGTPITCKVNVQGRWYTHITYEWSAAASNGEDLSERIRVSGDYVSIPTEGLGGLKVYTKVEAKGLDPSCNHSASGSTVVKR